MIDLIKLEFLYRKYRNGLRNDGKSYRFSRLKTFISFCAKRGCNYLGIVAKYFESLQLIDC